MVDNARGGWDGPVEIPAAKRESTWRQYGPRLAHKIQDALPAAWHHGQLWHDLSLGGPGDKGKYKTIRGEGGKSIGWEWTIRNPYARIQDEGGDIPIRPKGGMAHWNGETGREILNVKDDQVVSSTFIHYMTFFSKKYNHWFSLKTAAGFTLAGVHYISKGFNTWLDEMHSLGKIRPDEVLFASWADKS
jgi:hypothetical protein